MATKKTPSGILVRRIQFEYPDTLDAHWNPAKPEWSQVVNAASLLMPYLEPYLIDAIREATKQITDPDLLADARAYMGQEAHHYKQHRKFNEVFLSNGYERLRDYEKLLVEDYKRFVERRSLRFHLAYAAGFETMALALGHMLVHYREYFFRDADPNVSSLVLWHFVEEIEHKTAALGVYQHVCGSYFYRVYGLFFTMWHTLSRTRRAYKELLQVDGLWGRWRTRWELKKLMARIFAYIMPRALWSALPWHDPRRIQDPPWIRDWVALYDEGEGGLVRLDTQHIDQTPSQMFVT
jgi:predicted metal-dependent hydrolase